VAPGEDKRFPSFLKGRGSPRRLGWWITPGAEAHRARDRLCGSVLRLAMQSTLSRAASHRATPARTWSAGRTSAFRRGGGHRV